MATSIGDLGKLVVNIAADTTNFIRGITTVIERTLAFSQNVKVLTLGLSALSTLGLYAAYNSFRNLEDEVFRLDTAIRINGKTVEGTLAQYRSFSEALSKVSLTSKAGATAMLADAEIIGLSNETAQNAVKISQALAAAKGGEARSWMASAISIARGIPDHIQAVTGLEKVYDQQVLVNRLNGILTIGWQRMHEQVNTASGRIQYLNKSFSELLSEMGDPLVKVIEPFIENLQKLVDYFKDLSDEQKEFIIQLTLITAGISLALVALKVFSPLIMTLVSGIGLLFSALQVLVTGGLLLVYNVLSILATGGLLLVSGLFSVLTTGSLLLIGALKALAVVGFYAVYIAVLVVIKAVLVLVSILVSIITTVSIMATIKLLLFVAVLTGVLIVIAMVVDGFRRLSKGIVDAFMGFSEGIAGAFSAIPSIVESVSKFFADTWQGIANWWGDLWSGLSSTFFTTFSGIKDAIAAGDLKLAWEILTLGLETAWVEVIGKIKLAWLDAKNYSLDIIDQWAAGTASVVIDISTMWEKLGKTVEEQNEIQRQADDAKLEIQIERFKESERLEKESADAREEIEKKLFWKLWDLDIARRKALLAKASGVEDMEKRRKETEAKAAKLTPPHLPKMYWDIVPQIKFEAAAFRGAEFAQRLEKQREELLLMRYRGTPGKLPGEIGVTPGEAVRGFEAGGRSAEWQTRMDKQTEALIMIRDTLKRIEAGGGIGPAGFGF